jgi:hypothetical protein
MINEKMINEITINEGMINEGMRERQFENLKMSLFENEL